MSKKPVFLWAGVTMLSTQAAALDACKVSHLDLQSRICSYASEQRYVVRGVVGFPINLRFGDSERIKRAEFAYSGFDKDGAPVQSWRGPPAKDKTNTAISEDRFKTNLPIWPFHDGRSSLLVITQMPDGTERNYQFDLTARRPGDCEKSLTEPGCPADVTTTSSVAFVYPADEAAAAARLAAEKKADAVARAEAEQAAAKQQDAVDRLKQDIFYGGNRNWAYQFKGDPKWAALAPSEVSDNGWLTEMQWPENVQLPSITIIDPVTHEERIAPVSQQGHMQIVSTTSEWFRLRLGNAAVADVHNLRWSPNRPNPETGTTSPDVVRTVIYQDRKP